MNEPLSPRQRARLAKLYAQGLPARAVAEALGVATSTVYNRMRRDGFRGRRKRMFHAGQLIPAEVIRQVLELCLRQGINISGAADLVDLPWEVVKRIVTRYGGSYAT